MASLHLHACLKRHGRQRHQLSPRNTRKRGPPRPASVIAHRYSQAPSCIGKTAVHRGERAHRERLAGAQVDGPADAALAVDAGVQFRLRGEVEARAALEHRLQHAPLPVVQDRRAALAARVPRAQQQPRRGRVPPDDQMRIPLGTLYPPRSPLYRIAAPPSPPAFHERSSSPAAVASPLNNALLPLEPLTAKSLANCSSSPAATR